MRARRSAGGGRRRGLSIAEVVTAIPLLLSLLLLLHRAAWLAGCGREDARRVAERARREASWAGAVADAARGGALLEGLALTPDGRLVEGATPGAALQAWAAPAALVARRGAGHVVVARDGDRLVRLAIDGRGRVAREDLGGGVAGARFVLTRGPDGQVVGAGWEVVAVDGAAGGFVAARVGAAAAGPAAPAPAAAPRWTAGGGR